MAPGAAQRGDELTLLERSEHVSEWIRLKAGQLQSAQVAPIESKRPDGRGHRQQGGINAAVCGLKIERTDAQRFVKIDSLAPEVKPAAASKRWAPFGPAGDPSGDAVTGPAGLR